MNKKKEARIRNRKMSDREIHKVVGFSAVKQIENDKVIPTYKKTNRLVG